MIITCMLLEDFNVNYFLLMIDDLYVVSFELK
jgi:hypothetical protein